MRKHFRQSMAWLHTWAGLLAGWVLFFVFVTGTPVYYMDDITRWMQPEQPLRSEASLPPRGDMAQRALDYLARNAPATTQHWNIMLPGASAKEFQSPLQASWTGARGIVLDNSTGAEIAPSEVRDTEGGEAFFRMHYSLHYVSEDTGTYIVGICTLVMLLTLISGIVVHKKIFKDFFTFRPGKGQRSWLDAHNVTGVMVLPFFVMISYSGLLMSGQMFMPAPRAVSYGVSHKGEAKFHAETVPMRLLPMSRPAASVKEIIGHAELLPGFGKAGTLLFSHPSGEPPQVEIRQAGGDWMGQTVRFNTATGQYLGSAPGFAPMVQTRRWLIEAHFGRFAEAPLRLAYFVAGLLGCAMIATGLVLWTVKRRGKHAADSIGLRVVEYLNVATIAGLPTGVAAYFWANRLLSTGMADRADWEVNSLFLAWGWLAVYATARPVKRAWVEMLWIAAAAFAFLPVLNALTTNRHLGVTMRHGDWGLADIDLVMLGIGMIFAYAAWKVQRKWTASRSSRTAERATAWAEASQ